MKKIKNIPKKYFVILGVIVVVVGVWFFFIRDEATATTYIYGKVRTGEIALEVTGTGQISASNEIAMTSKSSGRITSLPVVVGQEIKSGQLIASVDSNDAYVDLENARIAYQKLVQPVDNVTAIEAEGSLQVALQSKKAAEGDIYTAYDSAFNEVSVTYIDVPTALTGVKELVDKGGYISENAARATNDTALSFRKQTEASYYEAKKQYDANIKTFQVLSRESDTASLEALYVSTYKMAQAVAELLKNAKNTADYIYNRSSESSSTYTEVRDSLDTWTSTNNGHVTALNTAITKIQTSKSNLESAIRDVNKSNESIVDLEDGADPLDVRSQLLSLQQKENAYADTFTRAPFDGVLAKLNVKLGDEVNSGTEIGTFITKQKIATISLNEIDAAKIKTGQKVTLTVDAIDGLKIDGTVSEVDLVGTVSQGVVTYSVKIALDTQDERIRSGMSISATVVSELKTGILMVPNAAIKNGSVQTKTGMVKVEMGLSNDTMTEIISGLKEGDEVVVRTIAGTKTTTAAPSILGNMRTGGATRTR